MSENKESRIVTLTDGTTADFGARNNVIQAIDLETNTITFKVFTGEVHTIDLNAIPEEIKPIIFAYGVAAKIKSGLAGVKLQEVGDEGEVVNTLSDAIASSISSINEGKFSTRNSAEESEETLDDEVKYFAIASGVFDKFPFFNPDFAGVVKQEGDLLLWNDETTQETIVSISKAWDSLDRKQKNVVRKSQYFKLVEGHALQALFKKAAA
jgi:hypothetical protein